MKVEQVYAKYGPTIFARCRRLLKDPAAAEDATQDIFMKVMRHLELAPEGDGLLPWIHRITTNHCLNLLRDQKRHAAPVETLPEPVADDFEEELVSRNFANHVLRSAPEELRTPAVLYHGRGIEQAEVAAALGVSRRTVLYRLAAFTDRAMALNAMAEAGR